MSNKVVITEQQQKVVIDGKQKVAVGEKAVNVVARGTQGPSGASAVSRIAVTTATHYVAPEDLVAGFNIIGVNYAGDVTVYIPNGIPENRLIYVKDESGNAGVNQITVLPYNA